MNVTATMILWYLLQENKKQKTKQPNNNCVKIKLKNKLKNKTTFFL